LFQRIRRVTTQVCACTYVEGVLLEFGNLGKLIINQGFIVMPDLPDRETYKLIIIISNFIALNLTIYSKTASS
jgi:hypothetical protein